MIIIGSYWDDIFFAVIVMGIALVVGRMLRFFIGQSVKGASHKIKVDPTKYSFIKNAVEFIVYIIAIIVIFNSIPRLKDYGTALFASAGVLAAIVGFASQSAFSNIISGIFIVIFKPFSVGDRIRVGQLYQGDVEDITLRHTVIRDFENKRIVMPNTVISNETIVNSTSEEHLCILLELVISFSSSVDTAMRIMQQEALKHPLCLDNRTKEEKKESKPQVVVRLIGFTDLGVQLRAYVWAKDPTESFVLKCDLNKSIKERFDKEGIEFAAAQRTIIVNGNPPTPVS